MANRFRVALLVETSSRYGRGVLTGVANYIASRPHWTLFLDQKDLHHEAPHWLKQYPMDGIISRVTNEYLCELAASAGIPLVELTDRGTDRNLHMLRSDDLEIGKLAADHFLERGLRHFAFCGFRGESWSLRRNDGFAKTLSLAGFEAATFETAWDFNEAHSWHTNIEQVAAWVRTLPKPVGIMACNDMRGQHVLSACRLCEFEVPEEVAVIGVDNDELYCRLSHPPLSSVIPDAERIGHRAAELLDRLMLGEQVRPEVQVIPPLGIRARQSTDTMAVPDPEISAAIAFIREHACRGITVKDILEAVPISRSGLERGMRKYLNRSPKQEIRNAQIKHATRLLLDTDLTIDRIAVMCGFKHPEYMHVVFKREIGRTPGNIRSQN